VRSDEVQTSARKRQAPPRPSPRAFSSPLTPDTRVRSAESDTSPGAAPRDGPGGQGRKGSGDVRGSWPLCPPLWASAHARRETPSASSLGQLGSAGADIASGSPSLTPDVRVPPADSGRSPGTPRREQALWARKEGRGDGEAELQDSNCRTGGSGHRRQGEEATAVNEDSSHSSPGPRRARVGQVPVFVD